MDIFIVGRLKMNRKNLAGKIKKALRFLFQDDYVIVNYSELQETNQRVIESMKATNEMIKRSNLMVKEFSDKIKQHSKYAEQLTMEVKGRLNELNLLLESNKEKIAGFQKNLVEEDFLRSKKNDDFPELLKKPICDYLGIAMDCSNREIGIMFSDKLKKEHPDYAKENYEDESFLELLSFYKRWNEYLGKLN